MKKQNGITLIALIITIIVMLILVGVTINVALNGGLIEKAKNAAIQTEEQSIFEQLISLANYTNNGEIDVSSTYAAIQNEFGESNVSLSNGTLTVTGKHGTYTYTLTSSKIAIGENTEASSDDNSSNTTGGEESENNTGENIVKSKELLPKEEENSSFGDRLESGECPVASNTDGTITVGYADFSYLIEYFGDSYEARILTIKTKNNSYALAIDEISAQNYSNMINGTGVEGLENMQAKTWYRASSDDNYKNYSLYEDSSTFGDNMSPISLDDFEGGTIYSSSYLTRVINSF